MLDIHGQNNIYTSVHYDIPSYRKSKRQKQNLLAVLATKSMTFQVNLAYYYFSYTRHTCTYTFAVYVAKSLTFCHER